MSQEVHVTYRPELGDVLHAARLVEGEAWKTTSRVVAGLLLAGGVGLFVAGFRGWALACVALAAVEWFNLLPLSALVAYVEYRRNPKYREQYHLGLSPNGLAFQTSTVSTVLKWSHYSRFWETDRAFVLSYGPGVPTVIPKAAFATAADLEMARGILQTAVAPRW